MWTKLVKLIINYYNNRNLLLRKKVKLNNYFKQIMNINNNCKNEINKINY